MECPRCGVSAAVGALECAGCGVVFAKLRAARTGAEARQRPEGASGRQRGPAGSAAGWLGIPREGWRAALAGAGAALVLTFFPLLSFLLSPLVTLVHELGHTATLWLFGFPALPAFDFVHGGGVTSSDEERSRLVVAAWIGLALGGAWLRRGSRPALAAIAGGLVVYGLLLGSRSEELLIALMGHGGELAFGGLFLYRALTGWGCRIPAERPLYGFLAAYILIHDLGFGLSLARSAGTRAVYLEGKGGIDHDLVSAAAMLSTTLPRLAEALVVATLLVPPLAVLAARLRRRLGALAEDEL